MSPILSLDLTNNEINIVKGSASQANVNIEKAATFIIPQGSVKDGKVKERNMFLNALSEALQFGDFRCNNVILTLNDAAAIVRDFEIPPSSPKTMEKVVQNEMIQTYFADPASVIQYKVIDNKIDDAGDKKTVIRAAALDRDMVDEYYNILKELKLKPAALDLNINGIDKLFTPKTVINDTPIADISCFIIDFDGNYTNIYIFNNGRMAFYRHTNLGLTELKRSLAEKTFLASDEIDNMVESGFNFFAEKDPENPEAPDYFTMLKPFLYQFSDELQKLGQFYANRMEGQSIENYFIFGSGCGLNGFANYLSGRLNAPVEAIGEISNIKIKNEQKPLCHYLNAAGALIRY